MCVDPFAADGFVVQTGDPEGPAEGFIDPSTGKSRTIPLEIMVEGDKAPIYGETLEVCTHQFFLLYIYCMTAGNSGCCALNVIVLVVHVTTHFRNLDSTKLKQNFLLMHLERWQWLEK